MLRRKIVKQLREVSDAARGLEEFRLERPDTGESIDIDPVMAKCLITSTIAYAVLLVQGKVVKQDAEHVIAAIIAGASRRYAAER